MCVTYASHMICISYIISLRQQAVTDAFENNYSLCVVGFFARTTTVNLHLSDENTDSTIYCIGGMSFRTLELLFSKLALVRNNSCNYLSKSVFCSLYFLRNLSICPVNIATSSTVLCMRRRTHFFALSCLYPKYLRSWSEAKSYKYSF